MIAFDIISGEYLVSSDSLEYIDRQRSALSEKELPLIALGIIAAAPAFASQQSTSQGFIEDSHRISFYVTLISNAIIAMVCRIKPNGVRVSSRPSSPALLKGRSASALTALRSTPCASTAAAAAAARAVSTFSPEDDDGRAKSDLAKFGATAKMRFSNTVLSYGSQRPMLPIVYADDSRLLYESYTGTMLTSREIDGLEINAGYLTDQQRKSDDSHNSGLKSLTFGGASYQFNDQLSGALYASHVEDVLNKQYLGLNYKQPFATDQQLIVDFNGYNSRLNQEYADANGTGRSNSIWSLAASYIWDIHTFKVAYQQSSGSTGYHYGGYQNRGRRRRWRQHHLAG